MEARAGILLVHKSPGMTSHDVVQLARRRLGTRRIGHTGTLDPMAEGLLILVIGSATKQQQALQAQRKTYEAVIQFGVQTDTSDAWGRPLQTASVPPLDPARVRAVLASCRGTLTQVPPTFSAVKVQGRPLYDWARRGQPRVAAPRQIEIFSIELLEVANDWIRVRVACSSGTYIRRLAETIAERLGTVGHLTRLLRLVVGPWQLCHAQPTQWLAQAPVEELWEAVQRVG